MWSTFWNNIDAFANRVEFGSVLWNNIDAFDGGGNNFDVLDKEYEHWLFWDMR